MVGKKIRGSGFGAPILGQSIKAARLRNGAPIIGKAWNVVDRRQLGDEAGVALTASSRSTTFDTKKGQCRRGVDRTFLARVHECSTKKEEAAKEVKKEEESSEAS